MKRKYIEGVVEDVFIPAPGFEISFIDSNGSIKYAEHIADGMYLACTIDGTEEREVRERFNIISN